MDEATTNRTRESSGMPRRRRRSKWGDIPLADPPPDKGLLPPVPKAERGRMDLIDQTYESLDYDTCLNYDVVSESIKFGKWRYMKAAVCSTFICAMSGIVTGLIGVLIVLFTDKMCKYKFTIISDYFTKGHSLTEAFFVWISINALFGILASVCGSVIEPVAAGSGIPLVKCYLNGVKIPRVVRLKTLLCKTIGVTFSVIGGLVVGKEGPMIHSGAVVAAGLSQGKSSTFDTDFRFFYGFREDHKKRDFVAAGSAAGVGAAFGATIGGVLFALEEGASFWNQYLTWNSFIAAGSTTLTLNTLLSLIYGTRNRGLLNFGEFDNLVIYYDEVALIGVMSLVGGLGGALFNQLNKILTVWRMRWIDSAWRQVVEVCGAVLVTTLVAFLTIVIYPDCQPAPANLTISYPVTSICSDGDISMTARLFLATPETTVVNLFHDPNGTYNVTTLFVYFAAMYIISCYTYGLGIPAGLFIPALLTGAAFGRLVAVLIGRTFPFMIDDGPEAEGKYALIGACIFLGGVVRMTLSLVCILTECVGEITFILVLFCVIHLAKFAGDRFNHGLYDIHVRLIGVPFLESKSSPFMDNLFAEKIMNQPLVCVPPVVSVRWLLMAARNTKHNGFPVVIDPSIDFSTIVEDNSDDDSMMDSSNEVIVTVDGHHDSNVNQSEHTDRVSDLIDDLYNAPASFLKDHCQQHHVRIGLDKDEVLHNLLMDSCINRFSDPPGINMDHVPMFSNNASNSDSGSSSGASGSNDSKDSATTSPSEQIIGNEATPLRENALDDPMENLYNVKGVLCGLIMRSQIMVLLKHKMFIENHEHFKNGHSSLRIFRDAYPRYYDLEAVDLQPMDLDCHIDLRKYMNPSPYTVPRNMTMPRVFQMFRQIGLRHLIVVDSCYHPLGMITRKDLVKFYPEWSEGEIKVKRMNVHRKV